MAHNFILVNKETGTSVEPTIVDRELCQGLGVPHNPKAPYMAWILFMEQALPYGHSFQGILDATILDAQMTGTNDDEHRRFIALVKWLDLNYEVRLPGTN